MIKKTRLAIAILLASICSISFAVVNGINIDLNTYEVDGVLYVRATPPPQIPSVGTGYNCDKNIYDYCIDTQLVEQTRGPISKDVTWSFSASTYIGWHADGETRWVAPVIGSSVNLISVTTNGLAIGVDADPDDVDAQGILNASNGWGNYVAAQDVTQNLPYTLNANTSLVAGVQRNEAVDGDCGAPGIVGKCLSGSTTLSFYTSVPANNFGRDQLRMVGPGLVKAVHSMSEFDLTRIPSDSRFTGTTANMTDIVNTWQWSFEYMRDQDNGEVSRAFRSDPVVPDYGAGVTQKWYDHLAQLSTDDITAAEKREAIAAMLTYGQDMYYAFYHDPSRFANAWGGAAQSIGISTGAFLFAALRNDPAFSNRLALLSATPDDKSINPQEIYQVQIRANGTVPVWGDEVDPVERFYWGGLYARQCWEGATGTCDQQGGNRTQRDPYGYIDGPENRPGASYMGVASGGYRAIAAAMALIPELCSAYNRSMLIDYSTRIFTTGARALPDPCAPPDTTEPPACEPFNAATSCDHYGLSGKTTGLTWGPNPHDLTQCIQNSTICTDTGTELSCVAATPGDPNFGQNGRFTSWDQTPIVPANTSAQWEANYNSIVAATTCGS